MDKRRTEFAKWATHLLKPVMKALLVFVIISFYASGCASTNEPINNSKTPSTNTQFQSYTITLTPSPTKPLPPFITSALNDSWNNIVVKADLIVSGNITNLRYDVLTDEQGKPKSVNTIYTLSVDKVVKGEPNTKEVFIKSAGGIIGDSEVLVEPAFRFRISDEMLACLHSEGNNTYTIFIYGYPPDTGGLLWYNGPGEHPPDIQKIIGRVIKIMLANNIPITLPEKDRPPMPVDGLVTPPPKQ